VGGVNRAKLWGGVNGLAKGRAGTGKGTEGGISAKSRENEKVTQAQARNDEQGSLKVFSKNKTRLELGYMWQEPAEDFLQKSAEKGKRKAFVI